MFRCMTLCLLLLTLWSPLAALGNACASLSLSLNDAALADALRLLAEACQKNLVISPSVSGTVSLTLHHESGEAALLQLVRTQDLVIEQEGDMAFVLPREILLEKKHQAAAMADTLSRTTPLETRLFQIHYATASESAEWLSGGKNSLLSPRGSLQAVSRTNQLLVQDTPDRLKAIAALIRQMDIPIQQVRIETRLASVDRHSENELGLDFSLLSPRPHSKMHEETSGIRKTGYSLAVLPLADSALLDIRLAALEESGKAELLSRPRLFTANRQPAIIESGEEIPYQEISRSGATGIAFRKAVLSLEVTPIILPQKKVLLELRIHQDKPATRVVLGVPAITTRQINTRILARNGETLVIGGIYENSESESHTGFPFLAHLPVAGRLFGKTVHSVQQRELLVFVTPWIVPSP